MKKTVLLLLVVRERSTMFFFSLRGRKTLHFLVALTRAVVGKPSVVFPLPFTSRILLARHSTVCCCQATGSSKRAPRRAWRFPRRMCMASLAFRRSEA